MSILSLQGYVSLGHHQNMKKKAQHLRLHSSKLISNQGGEGGDPSGQWEENLTKVKVGVRLTY